MSYSESILSNSLKSTSYKNRGSEVILYKVKNCNYITLILILHLFLM
jgi:hypothetical protein